MSKLHKLVALSGCAALVAAGYACGSWQAGTGRVSQDEFLNAATAAEQFGKDFSALTAGKSWSEIQAITANTKAGAGPLGAAYSALDESAQQSFRSATAASLSGTTGASAPIATQSTAPAKTATSETQMTSAHAISDEEKKALKTAIKAHQTTLSKNYCDSKTDYVDLKTNKWYLPEENKAKECQVVGATRTCSYNAGPDPATGKDAFICLKRKPLCTSMSGGIAETACHVSSGDNIDKYQFAFKDSGADLCAWSTCESGVSTAEHHEDDQENCCKVNDKFCKAFIDPNSGGTAAEESTVCAGIGLTPKAIDGYDDEVRLPAKAYNYGAWSTLNPDQQKVISKKCCDAVAR